MKTENRQRIVRALRVAAVSLVEGAKGGTPQIYVAHLGAYNAGKLKGDWIEPATDEEALGKQIAEACGVKEGDDFEWAVHDYNDFPDLGEHPGMDDIAAVAEMLEENDDPLIVEAALDYAGNNDIAGAKKALENGYEVYDSEKEAGERLVDDLGTENMKTENYIDMDALARDLLMEESIVYVNGKPFVFHG